MGFYVLISAFWSNYLRHWGPFASEEEAEKALQAAGFRLGRDGMEWTKGSEGAYVITEEDFKTGRA